MRTLWTLSLWATLAAPGAAQVTELVSRNDSGVQANGLTTGTDITPDARYVAFNSAATNLGLPNDRGHVFWMNVYVRDRFLGITRPVSVNLNGEGGNFPSENPSLSNLGQVVAHESWAFNLVFIDSPTIKDIIAHDLTTGDAEYISISIDDGAANGDSHNPSVSGNGALVAFDSMASNLIANDNNGTSDIFVRNRFSGTTRRIPNGHSSSYSPSLSFDGRRVAYATTMSHDPIDDNGKLDIYIHDVSDGSHTLVSVGDGGVAANGISSAPSLSDDGLVVAFVSAASNLVPGDTNGRDDIFVRDLRTGTTVLASVSSGGDAADRDCLSPSLSAEGGHVAFQSRASNLVPNDVNGVFDIFLRDLSAGSTTLMSQGENGAATEFSVDAATSGDGQFVAFMSDDDELVSGDRGHCDVFVRGPGVSLDANRQMLSGGELLEFGMYQGAPGVKAGLYLVDLDGESMRRPVGAGHFDAAGQLQLHFDLPLDLPPMRAVFQCLSRDADGRLVESNTVPVVFR